MILTLKLFLTHSLKSADFLQTVNLQVKAVKQPGFLKKFSSHLHQELSVGQDTVLVREGFTEVIKHDHAISAKRAEKICHSYATFWFKGRYFNNYLFNWINWFIILHLNSLLSAWSHAYAIKRTTWGYASVICDIIMTYCSAHDLTLNLGHSK